MWVRVVAAIVLLIFPCAAFAQAEKRIALLVGNRAYDASVGVLRNPHNDISVVGEALAMQGFEVLPPIKDARRSAILGGVRELVRKLNAAGSDAIGFLYYSGHGAAEKDTNINYLIPVDAKEPGTTAFWDESLKLDDVLRLLDGARSAAKFIVFDACRNELQLPTKDTTKGLVAVVEQQGMFIAYASAPGRTASDRGEKSGPYAQALATELGKPGADHLSLFQNVKEAVYTASGGAQQPWESNGLVRRVYLTRQPSAQPKAPAGPARVSEAAEAWDRTKDATNIVALEAFIRRFGDTYYGDLAKARLDEIKRGSTASIAVSHEYPDLATTDCQPTRTIEIAARACSDIIARFPTFAMAYAIRGSSYRRQGEREQALTDLNRALELDPTNTFALARRIWVFAAAGDDQRAQADFERLVAINPSRPIDFDNLGLAYFYKKDHDRAISEYNKAIDLDPKLAQAYSNRGNAYRTKLDYDRAIADYSKAIELDPKFAVAHSNRGYAYLNKRDDDRAIIDLSRAIELDPKFVQPYSNRGIAYANKADYDRALADHNRAIELDPKFAGVYNDRGLTYRKKRDFDLAIIDYTKAIELNPKYALAYNNRGYTYTMKRDYDRAMSDHNKAIELDPKYAGAYNDRGVAYRNKHDFDRAIADYTKAIELNPRFAIPYSNRGVAYASKQDYDRAMSDHSKAIELDPKFAAAYNDRGTTYQKMNNKSAAIEDYRKALELDPNFMLARENLKRFGLSQ